MSLLSSVIVQVNPPVLVPSIVSPPEPVLPIVRIGGGTVAGGTEFFITDLSIDYRKYTIVFSGLNSTDQSQTDILLTTSTDNGATYTNSADSYVYRMKMSSGSNGQNNHWTRTDTAASLVRAIGSTNTNFQGGQIDILDPADPNSRTTIITTSGGRINADGNPTNPNIQQIMSQRQVTEANNAVRIFVAAGHFNLKYTIFGWLA